MDLMSVEDIEAFVLVGSYAAGKAPENADIDIGIYDAEETPFSMGAITTLAAKCATSGNCTVTGFYDWGPWVNGGAWIQTTAGKVDVLYRNIEQVTATIKKAHLGAWENDFEQQPPYGFSSIM